MSIAHIESLDHEGRGVAHVEGKTIFIDGGLPGEQVAYSSFKKKKNYEQALLTEIHSESSQRVVKASAAEFRKPRYARFRNDVQGK